MRPLSVDERSLVEALGSVICRHGIEGASLSRLSEASGLKRASLYHRFPGGKDEIVAAVVQRARERFDEALAPAYGDGDPHERAVDLARNVSELYDGGRRTCLITALALADQERREAVAPCVAAWIAALTRIATDAGMGRRAATAVAAETVAAIQGSLVIAVTTGDTRPFERAVDASISRLTSTD